MCDKEEFVSIANRVSGILTLIRNLMLAMRDDDIAVDSEMALALGLRRP